MIGQLRQEETFVPMQTLLQVEFPEEERAVAAIGMILSKRKKKGGTPTREVAKFLGQLFYETKD